MSSVGTDSNLAVPSGVQGDTSYYADAAPDTTGTPQQHTTNRWGALFEAGSNIHQNNQNTLSFIENDQRYALQRESIDFERDKFGLGIALQNRNVDMNFRTVDSQATITDAHSSALLGIQKQMDALDASDPQYQRKLAALTNSFATISQLGSQANSNITTQTAQGHGSVQTAQQGMLGANSNTAGQSIDAGVAVSEISADTQLGLADKKVTLDTTLAGTQANVAIHHTDKVGAEVAEGQKNYYTGIGNNTAGFTNGANYNANYNATMGGIYPTPFSGSIPPVTPSAGTPSPTTPAPTSTPLGNGSILSGQIQTLMGS
jgi:hypothetical protein